MDAAIAQTIIGAAIGAIVTLIATFVAQYLSKKQNLEHNYDEKLEEIQNLYLEVKTHIEAEIREWWIEVEINDEKRPNITLSNYIYPVDKIIMLVERYEPSLMEDIKQVIGTIHTLRGNEDPECWIPLKAYYYQYIKDDNFSEVSERLTIKFKKINQKYYQKRSSKLLRSFKKTTARSNNQNQIQLPHVLKKVDDKTISDDEW